MEHPGCAPEILALAMENAARMWEPCAGKLFHRRGKMFL